MDKIAITLITLNLCHWAADYTQLSTAWMLSAKRLGKPLLPILAHAFVHAVLFFIAVGILFNIKCAVFAFLFQLITHFLIDVWKGRMNGWFPSLKSPANVYHWWVFGFDQLLHQVVIICIVWIIYTF